MGFSSWFAHRPQKAVRRAVRSHRTDSVLAQAPLVTSAGDAWAFATRAELLLISAPEVPAAKGDTESRGAPSVVVHREWADVDRATYDTESNVIRVHWVDGDEPTPIALDGRRTVLPQVLRERVQWSVVLAEPVKLPGQARDDTAATAPRKSLLSPQDRVPAGLEDGTCRADGHGDPFGGAGEEQVRVLVSAGGIRLPGP